MTSLTTFENRIRERLLDLLYAQAEALGAAVAAPDIAGKAVIDPEAWLWCVIEGATGDARLQELAAGWVAAYTPLIARQRVLRQGGLKTSRLAELLRGRRSKRPASKNRIGQLDHGPRTLVLRARAVVGLDVRHVLIVYLLANRGTARLRDVAAWSRYSYRALAEASAAWEQAELATVDAGLCRLRTVLPWADLLGTRSEEVVLVDWWSVYGAAIELRKGLEKARNVGLKADSGVVRGLVETARKQIVDAASGPDHAIPKAVSYLLESMESADLLANA